MQPADIPEIVKYCRKQDAEGFCARVGALNDAVEQCFVSEAFQCHYDLDLLLRGDNKLSRWLCKNVKRPWKPVQESTGLEDQHAGVGSGPQVQMGMALDDPTVGTITPTLAVSTGYTRLAEHHVPSTADNICLSIDSVMDFECGGGGDGVSDTDQIFRELFPDVFIGGGSAFQ